ncbi:chitobiase/beta-hexosaminidase C-terminal domain-containing protein [bacterium]
MAKKKFLLFILLIKTSFMLSAIEKPEYSHTRDFYDTAFNLQLTSTTANSIIRYTLDGSKPDQNNGIVYDGLISISKTTIVRAITFANDTLSNVRTHTFIFLDDVIHQDNSGIPQIQHNRDHVYWTEEFDMNDVTQAEDEIKEALKDIPSMSIVAAYDSLFGLSGILRGQNLMEGSGGKAGDPNDSNWHELVECSVEMIYPENEKFGKFKNWQENTGIKVQGGGGRWNNGYYDHKQSFTLEFKSRYGAGTLRNDIFKAAPFNRTSSPERFDKLVLRAGHNKSWGADWDRENTVYTRDQFGRDLQLLMSGWGSHGTFVHLYINGKYWGLYNPCERMDDNAMSIYFGGEDDDYYFGKGKGGDQSGNDDRYDYLRTTDWSNRQLSMLSEYLAIDEYIDICLVYCYANPGDGPQYYYGNRNTPPGPMYVTAWDIEDSFEGGSRRTGPPISGDKINFDVYPKIYRNIDFKMKFADRTYKHCFNNGILTDANASAVWDSLCGYIENAILCEIARWGDERGSVYDYEHWHQEWQDVKDDINGRTNKLISALKAVNMYPSLRPPDLKIADQIITETTLYAETPFQLEIEQVENTGTAYFATDGNDPRNWDLTGNVSPTANQIIGQSEMITINDTTIIKVRCKNGNTWSPLRELKIIPGPLTATENNDIFLGFRPDFYLYQNSPNPFNPTTVLRFTLPKTAYVSLRIYDILGREVEVLVDERRPSGSYQQLFDGSRLASGIYFARLNTASVNRTIKLLLCR